MNMQTCLNRQQTWNIEYSQQGFSPNKSQHAITWLRSLNPFSLSPQGKTPLGITNITLEGG